jgi:O-antigen biosynthesis protein WbqV
LFLLALDVCAAVAALVASFLLTLPGGDFTLAQFQSALPVLLLTTTVTSAAVFYVAGLSRRFWRFVSIVDLTLIVFAAGAAAVISEAAALLVLAGDKLPPAVFLLHWLLSIAIMSGMRVVSRFGPQALATAQAFGRPAIRKDAPRALLAGTPAAIDSLLREVETGVVTEFAPVGILDETDADVSRILRGVPILGRLEGVTRVVNELRAKGLAPDRIVVASNRQALSNPRYISLASAAAKLEVPVSHAVQRTDADVEGPTLREFDMSELLGRAPAKLDAAAIGRALCGKRILVTGAGGSIGGELVRQIAGFEPEKLIIIDSSEFNLYKIDQELRESFDGLSIETCLCDIRDRQGVFKAVETHDPELVFHAAALKHVPLVEMNASIGAATNILGTKNVADAVKAFGVKAMIQVSTDKAVNPIGMMGATKRVGEIYCQSLDMEGADNPTAPRFMTVRFGNVLGSSGSVVPLFHRQLKERVPLTVTHPDMTRYFMTIHEAVSLVLQSTQYAFEKNVERGLVFVLDMGDPIRIVDMAHRMIRLSGSESWRRRQS